MHRTIRHEKSGFVHYKKTHKNPDNNNSKSAADGEVWRHGHDACTEKLLFVRHLSCNSIGYWFHTINCLPSVPPPLFFFLSALPRLAGRVSLTDLQHKRGEHRVLLLAVQQGIIASFDQPASKYPLAVADECRHTCWREVYRFRQSGRWMCVGPQCMANTNARFYFKAPVGQVWCLSRKRFHSFVILVDVASVCSTSPAGSAHCLLNQLCCLLCILVAEGVESLVFVVLMSNFMIVYIYLRDRLHNFVFISIVS